MLPRKETIHPQQRQALSLCLTLFARRSLLANFPPYRCMHESQTAPLLRRSLHNTNPWKFLLLSEMADDITTLEETLASTDNDEERIGLLHQFCRTWQYSRPHQTIRLAKEALTLAAAARDRAGQGRSYLLIGSGHYHIADYRRGEHYLKKAARLATSIDDQSLMADVLNVRGQIYSGTGAYGESLRCLNQALEICERIESPMLRVVLNNLAPVYSQLGDYAAGLECLYRSLPLYEAAGESTAGVELHIGYIHAAAKNREKADEHTRRALSISRERGDLRGEGAALKNLATILVESGDLDAGMEAAHEALEIARRIDNPTMAILSMQCIAVSHFNRSQVDESLRWHQDALELASRLEQRDTVGVEQLNIAGIYQAQGKHSEAIALAREVVATAEAIGYRELEQNAHQLLSELYEHLGDATAALRHFRQVAALNEERLGAEMRNSINRIQMRAEMEKSERDREILRLKTERLELEMGHKMKELTALAMQLVQKNEMLDDLKKQIGELAASKNGSPGSSGELAPILRQIETSRNSEQEWDIFEQQFRALHPEFMDTMAQQCPDLSPTELKVCALMKINLATKEIANILCCSVRTVEDHRYRVRSKLGLPKGTNLGSYLASLKGRRSQMTEASD